MKTKCDICGAIGPHCVRALWMHGEGGDLFVYQNTPGGEGEKLNLVCSVCSNCRQVIYRKLEIVGHKIVGRKTVLRLNIELIKKLGLTPDVLLCV